MSEETNNETTKKEAAAAPSEQKIMCFVSKQMVPLSQTVEVEYAPGKKVRVLPRYVKFEQSA